MFVEWKRVLQFSRSTRNALLWRTQSVHCNNKWWIPLVLNIFSTSHSGFMGTLSHIRWRFIWFIRQTVNRCSVKSYTGQWGYRVDKIVPCPLGAYSLAQNLQYFRAQWENVLVSSVLSGTLQISKNVNLKFIRKHSLEMEDAVEFKRKFKYSILNVKTMKSNWGRNLRKLKILF